MFGKIMRGVSNFMPAEPPMIPFGTDPSLPGNAAPPAKRGLFGRPPANNMMMLGALLQDLDAGGGENMAAMQKSMLAQREKAEREGMQKRLIEFMGGDAQASSGGQPALASGAPRTAGAPSLTDPRWPLMAVLGKQAGLDLAPAIDVMKANKREYVNGVGYNPYDPNAPSFVPTLDKGQAPEYDSRGQIVGVRNMDGSVAAAAEMAGATEGAKSQAQSAYDLVDVPQSDGSTRKMTRLQAAQVLGGQGGGAPPPAGGGPRLGYAPSPAQIEADKVTATAAANKAVDYPGKMQGFARQLSALDEMEQRLPDVVSGFGSEARLQGLRALAAVGNEDAKRQVAATETFLNQGRILVSDMIKSFGANPTEGERKYAERMSGADAALNPETLKEGIRLQRERINREMGAASAGAGATARSTATPNRGAVEAEMRRRGLIR